jgi:hypothetical protein
VSVVATPWDTALKNRPVRLSMSPYELAWQQFGNGLVIAGSAWDWRWAAGSRRDARVMSGSRGI